MNQIIRFCMSCGQPTQDRTPEGDNRSRAVCGQCGEIHYVNPKIVAGAVAVYEDRVLLCRRAIEPRKNYWTLPAGFMENNETVAEAAQRETREEAEGEVTLHGLLSIGDVPHIGQVHMYYLGDLIEGKHSVGVESLETRLFSEADIPWDDLAFKTVTETLRYYFSLRARPGFVASAPGEPYQFTAQWKPDR
ncbi:NUDIX hydrolase [Allohahella marinimesophila]|uniref:NUDIX hydrolase n=1 Tax=Allohahella marinimesophila TaxID=1054972 RepID=A0ABP7NR58_9GAMM